MKKLIFTKPEIIRDNQKFIRVELDWKVADYIIRELGFEAKFSGPPDFVEFELFNDNKELIMFNDIDIGYKDYRATYGEKLLNGGWDDAYYIREDYLYLKDTQIPPKPAIKSENSEMDLIIQLVGPFLDKVFEEEAKEKVAETIEEGEKEKKDEK